MSTETANQSEPVTQPVQRLLPSSLQPLQTLSWNYWWSWAPDGNEVFRDLEPGLWQQCEHNPRVLLNQVSDLRLAQVAADPSFTDRVQRLSARFDAYLSDTRPSPKLQLAPHISSQTPVA
jgi:glucan phosphorylase